MTEVKKKRADRTDNEFRFLSAEGLSHVLQTGAKNGDSVGTVLTRICSWKRGEVNLNWIAEKFRDGEPGTPYFTNPRNRTDEDLKNRFSSFCTAFRALENKAIDDFVATIKQCEEYNRVRDELIAAMNAGEELSDEAMSVAIGDPLPVPKAEDYVELYPVLGHSGERESTKNNRATMVNANLTRLGIDLNKLKGLSVIKAGR